MADICADTIVAAIVNVFVEFLRTAQKFTLVVFDDDLSNKYIKIGASMNAIDLPNGDIIYRINYTPLLHGGSN